ncbi:isochorismatase family protein [Streptomyces sp. NPDC059697]|uniref:isochorismatase family protein n=1 Tax=Streptomyces sp. NPDC059697 TaxID=3346912 RepID=UPI0036A6895F
MAVSTLDPNTALVVIDLQNGIVGNRGLAPYPAAEVVERAARLADAFRERSLPVVPYLTYHDADTYRRSLSSIIASYPTSAYYAYRT